VHHGEAGGTGSVAHLPQVGVLAGGGEVLGRLAGRSRWSAGSGSPLNRPAAHYRGRAQAEAPHPPGVLEQLQARLLAPLGTPVLEPHLLEKEYQNCIIYF